MYRGFLKRLIDIIFAVIILVVSSPVLLVIAIAVKLDSRGPAIFSQRRLGRNGKEGARTEPRHQGGNAHSRLSRQE